MSDSIVLIGAEEVRQGAFSMRQAAQEIYSSSANFHGAVDRMERLVERFEVAARELADKLDRIGRSSQ